MKNKSIKIKKNNFIFFIFCFFVFAILFLTVGYSAYSETLAIDGSALVRSMADVRITDYRVNNSNSATSNSSEFTNNSITSNNYISWYWSNITYDVTVTNLSSSDVLVTDATALVFSNDIFTYHFENLEINKTVIPAASTYTFQVVYEVEESVRNLLAGTGQKLESIVEGGDVTLQSTIEFTFYKIPQYTYEITATPSDAYITIEVDGNVVASGNGNVSKLIDEGTNVSYSVTLDGYYTETGVDTITTDISRTVTLKNKLEHQFTVIPNFDDAVVTLKVNGEVMATGNGTQSIDVLDQTVIDYTVTKFEYYDVSGTYTINGEDHTENVVLEEMPYITGTFTNTSWSSATTKEDTVYHPGYYLIELWGGKGGNQMDAADNAGYGGASGHVYGVAYLDYGTTTYFTLGGNGEDGKNVSASGGANGGGNSAALYAAGGAGYSAFAINTTSISETTINSGNVLLISGGGGGGGANSTLVSTRKPGDGGAGGNMTSTFTVITIGTVFHGADGTINDGTSHTYGLGGTTTSTTLSNAGYAGSMLSGGKGSQKGGGGGAGYYGGAGGGAGGTTKSDGAGGGGGGSSLVASSVIFDGLSSTITSNLVNTNPSSSGGAIVITYLGKSL